MSFNKNIRIKCHNFYVKPDILGHVTSFVNDYHKFLPLISIIRTETVGWMMLTNGSEVLIDNWNSSMSSTNSSSIIKIFTQMRLELEVFGMKTMGRDTGKKSSKAVKMN